MDVSRHPNLQEITVDVENVDTSNKSGLEAGRSRPEIPIELSNEKDTKRQDTQAGTQGNICLLIPYFYSTNNILASCDFFYFSILSTLPRKAH